eukprot:scaffold207451_cov32-Tisochrysis_lutea.AAC.2
MQRGNTLGSAPITSHLARRPSIASHRTFGVWPRWHWPPKWPRAHIIPSAGQTDVEWRAIGGHFSSLNGRWPDMAASKSASERRRSGDRRRR